MAYADSIVHGFTSGQLQAFRADSRLQWALDAFICTYQIHRPTCWWFYYRATVSDLGRQPISMNICCIDLGSSYSLTQMLMFWLSGNFKRFELTSDFSEYPRHRSWLTVFADPTDNGFTISGNFKHFGMAADFSEHLLHRYWLIVFADPNAEGLTTGQVQAFWADGRF